MPVWSSVWMIWNSRAAARLQPLPVVFRRGLGDRVLADPAEDVVERGVLGEPILIARPVGDQVAQDVVADPA